MGLSSSQHASEDQRSVILIGETGAGKSAFGNFLLKSHCFKTGDSILSTTQSVEQRSSQFTEGSLNINLHVFDLPGLNDPRKLDTTYLNNTYAALKKCAKCLSTLFCIVIDISDTDGLASAVKEIHKFIDKVELPDFNLTDNALLVFSHADKLGATHEEADSSLFREIETCLPLYKLWMLVRFRYVLVDSLRYSADGEYWREKMKEILLFTRPKIRVLLLGPYLSAQTELLLLLSGKRAELGGEEEPRNDEVDIGEVSLDAEGCSVTFEKSFDFSSMDDLNEQPEGKEESNALSQVNSLVNSIAESHTFAAFCVVINMTKLRSTFIQGIKAFASALSEGKTELFYNRCFFLFTHSNKADASTQCGLAFSKLADMRELRDKMGNRVAIANTHPDTPTELVSELLRQIVSYSYAMKQKCYGKEFVTSVLSTGFEFPPDSGAVDTPQSSSWPSKLAIGLLALTAGGGILAIAGAAPVLTKGAAAAPTVVVAAAAGAPAVALARAAAPAVAYVMKFAAPMLPQVGPVDALRFVDMVSVATLVVSSLGALGVGTDITMGSAALYKLISQRMKKGEEGDQEFEYDFSTNIISLKNGEMWN